MPGRGITVCHVHDPTVPGVDEIVYGGRHNGGGMEVNPAGRRGWLGNPFSAEKFGRIPCILMCVGAFEIRVRNDTDFKWAVDDLRGKAVACFCRSITDDEPPCHLDIVDHHLRGDLGQWVADDLIPRLTVSRERLIEVDGIGDGMADTIIEHLRGADD